MSWTKRSAYSYGLEEGDSAFSNTKNDSKLFRYWSEDRLGEYVGELLDSYRQYADTIYYDFSGEDYEDDPYRVDEIIDKFEEGFYRGFERAANKYFKRKSKV
jgi:hypothetical protein